MNLKVALLALAMVGAAMASQSYHGTRDKPYSYYSESQSYNQPSYKSTHGASYYDEPVTIKGKSYRPDFDSNKNNDYTFVTISGDDDYEIQKEVKGDIYHKDDHHHQSSYHQVDDKPNYGSSYNRPSYQKQEPTYRGYKEQPSYQMSHKQENSYKVPSYQTTYKPKPSYMVHKEEPSYKMPSYKQETPYKAYQPSHHDSYQKPTHYKDSYKQQSYKEMSGYGKQDQYQDHDLYNSNYQQASELISNAGIHGYSAKSKAAPIIVKMTTMNNNKNVYNKQYDH